MAFRCSCSFSSSQLQLLPVSYLRLTQLENGIFRSWSCHKCLTKVVYIDNWNLLERSSCIQQWLSKSNFLVEKLKNRLILMGKKITNCKDLFERFQEIGLGDVYTSSDLFGFLPWIKWQWSCVANFAFHIRPHVGTFSFKYVCSFSVFLFGGMLRTVFQR